MLLCISVEEGCGLAVHTRCNVEVYLVIALPGGHLVDLHLCDARIVRLQSGQFRVFAQHRPVFLIVDTALLSDSVERHRFG